MGNSLLNTRDQKFVLYEQLGIDKLFETKAFGEYSRDVVELMLTEAEKMAVEVLLPGRKEGDTGVKFKDGNVFVPEMFHEIYKKFNEGGWIQLHEGCRGRRAGNAHGAQHRLLRILQWRPTSPSLCTPASPTARPTWFSNSGQRGRKSSTWKKCTPESGEAPCA